MTSTEKPWSRSRHAVPGNWRTLKARVLTDHNRICHTCRHGDADQVDHVLNLARGGTHDPSNLAPIHTQCPTCGERCHHHKTQHEAAAGRARYAHKRGAESHPGIIE